MSHWTQVLANVALVEVALLAVLTFVEWVRHRMRGSGWVFLAFLAAAAVSLTVKVDPGLLSEQDAVKPLLAVLALTPYCLFRFAASFHRPRPSVRALAVVATSGVIVFTFVLRDLPVRGAAGAAASSCPTASAAWWPRASCSASC